MGSSPILMFDIDIGSDVGYHGAMYILGTHISIDLPEHAIGRAAERLDMSEREVIDFWRKVAASRQDDLADIDIATGGRISSGRIHWVVTRYSERAIRVMTVVIKEKRKR